MEYEVAYNGRLTQNQITKEKVINRKKHYSSNQVYSKTYAEDNCYN